MIKAERLAGLQPEAVFGYFENMPHGSGNTKQISDYFVSFAKENGLRCIQDDAENVILFKDASAGYEDHAPVILQAHMDMVCQVDEGSGIDMATTPLDVTHDEKYVYARRTSPGAGGRRICGIFSEKVEGLDCVSAGPTALYIHTNREKMDIASMAWF